MDAVSILLVASTKAAGVLVLGLIALRSCRAMVRSGTGGPAPSAEVGAMLASAYGQANINDYESASASGSFEFSNMAKTLTPAAPIPVGTKTPVARGARCKRQQVQMLRFTE